MGSWNNFTEILRTVCHGCAARVGLCFAELLLSFLSWALPAPLESLLKNWALCSDCCRTSAACVAVAVAVAEEENPDLFAALVAPCSRRGSIAKHCPALLRKAKSAAVRGVAPSPTV